MDPRVPMWSTLWSDQHRDEAEDFHSNSPWMFPSRSSISPLDAHTYPLGGAHYPYSRSHLSDEESELFHPQPSFVPRAAFITGNEGWRRSSLPSCDNGSIGSSVISSTFSERHFSPPFSPDVVPRTHTRPSSVLPDDVSYTYDGFSPRSRHDSHNSVACIAPNEVQILADEPPEVPAVVFSNESHTWLPGAYSTYIADDGYVPMDQDQEPDEHTPGTYLSTPNSSEYHTQATSRHQSEEQDQEPVQIRRRRAPSTATLTSPQPSTARVSKRPQNKRHSSSYRSNKSVDDTSETKKVFPCSFAAYGCTSSFGNKNEWKRHVHTQHLRLAYWRCEQCADIDNGRKPNDFNRRDLFIQHVRRMHPFTTDGSSQSAKSRPSRNLDEDQYLTSEANRCHRQLRQAPQSSRCLLCDQHFRGENSWDQRMEHVGRHFEDSKRSSGTPAQDPQQWHIDRDLEQYLLDQEILVRHGQILILPEHK
ncbi:Putative transcription factor Grauzone [Septoria linicola]|uniref:Transcription factor Grauzone n=1 Tax=Septoria linicola TaxID=215465 RepID=A0A9Q9ALU5_9PEZI|nr:putative transcription factor Grauzone [Septoria linicola]USW47171.1 Putative transcription factor Grauzone [Septoria linicola]